MSSARRSRVSRRSKSPDAPSGEQTLGLRAIVQKRLLDDVFQASSDKVPGWKILVVDDHAMRVISAAVGMYDIMERKITLVESLEKKRAPFPDMGAIYLLAPTPESVAKLLADYQNVPASKILYGNGVFLYFLGRLPDRLLDQIKGCKPLLKRLKALNEINVDFLAKEERAFMLDMRSCFSSLYLRKSSTPTELALSEKLVTVCATLNEYPHIRYKQSSGICQSLASVFHLKMDEYVANNPTWWYHGGPQKNTNMGKRERGVVLLLDRADDCLSPLMHDFTYQSMVHDLLPMNEDRITYQSETTNDPNQTEAKDVLLDERDTLWTELRGMHIAKVIETLSERIREIMNSSTGSTLGGGKGNSNKGNMSLSQMASALKALPEYREVMSKLSQHMHISHECMDVFRTQNLLDLSDLEQTMATGKDDDGRAPKLADMIDRVEGAVMEMRSDTAKIRLLLITTLSQNGLRPQDRRRLTNAASLQKSSLKALEALEVMGLATLAQAESRGAGNRLANVLSGGRISANAASDEEAEYAGSRYVPALKMILEDFARDSLSFDTYPSVLPMPENATSGGGAGSASARSARSARSSGRQRSGGGAGGSAADGGSSARKSGGATSRWAKSSGTERSRSTGPTNYQGGRCIVFMVGGMAFSELRVARQVMAKESREIIAGSTSFVTAEQFVEDLETLTGGGQEF